MEYLGVSGLSGYFIISYSILFSFDLWEELSSASFFTSAVQHKALRQGIALATKLGTSSTVSGWSAQANNVLCFLQVYIITFLKGSGSH